MILVSMANLSFLPKYCILWSNLYCLKFWICCFFSLWQWIEFPFCWFVFVDLDIVLSFLRSFSFSTLFFPFVLWELSGVWIVFRRSIIWEMNFAVDVCICLVFDSWFVCYSGCNLDFSLIGHCSIFRLAPYAFFW